MPRHHVSTVIPADCIFRFTARVRTESSGDRAGLRVTIPPAIVRGLRHLGWDGARLRVDLAGATFLARPRPQGASLIIALPKRYRGDLTRGDAAAIQLRDPGSDPAD